MKTTYFEWKHITQMKGLARDKGLVFFKFFLQVSIYKKYFYLCSPEKKQEGCLSRNNQKKHSIGLFNQTFEALQQLGFNTSAR